MGWGVGRRLKREGTYGYCFSIAKLCPTLLTPCTSACQASLSFTISWSWLKLMSIEPIMASNHLKLFRHLLPLPLNFPSIRVFPSVSALHIMWPWYWSLSISSYNEYSGLISLRIDWFERFAVQGTLKSHLYYRS